MNEDNEVLISPCTKEEDFKVMKSMFIKAINDVMSGAEMTLTTEQEEDNFIAVSMDIDAGSHGYGDYFGGVRFVNPESIINFIRHCAGFVENASLGFDVKDLSESEVEITIIAGSKTKH